MPSDDRAPQIVIVGGGFCGAALALHLARIAERPVAIMVIEPAAELGRGVAYSGSDLVYRINIPAARMAVFQDAPEHFHRFAESEGALAGDPEGLQPNGDLYARRRLFGDYVGTLLAEAVAARPHIRLTHVQGRAVGWRDGQVLLDDGRRIDADALAIATGNPRPALPAAIEALAGDDRVVVDPWGENAIAGIAQDARVLVLGTGLTMADAVASLIARGHRGAITAISRHGLRQRRKRPGPYHPQADFAAMPGDTALALLCSARRAVREAEAAGGGWEDAIEALRLQGRAIWRRLDEAERRRVLRHLRPWWDVHRYQVAPPIDDLLVAAIDRGQLAIHAGHVKRIDGSPDGLAVAWRGRGRTEVVTEAFDNVINATGPAVSRITATNPFLADLQRQGLIYPDPLGLGLATDPCGMAIGSSGPPNPIVVLGSLARGAYGELAGIRELSAQAGDVALALARRFRLADRLPTRGDLLQHDARQAAAAVQSSPEPIC